MEKKHFARGSSLLVAGLVQRRVGCGGATRGKPGGFEEDKSS